MQVQVLGMGKSGLAAAELLLFQGHAVWVCDENSSPTLLERRSSLEDLGAQVRLGEPFEALPTTELIVVSPGVNWQLPALEAARSRGIETIGEAELAWRSLRDVPWVGITGTNGKTTTTALIAAIFAVAGLHAPACGNIGLPLCTVALDALKSSQKPDWIVAELSSYQVESSSTLAPHIGLWTTLTDDHLSRHGSFQRYAQIKASLPLRSQQAILNLDDPYILTQRPHWPQASWTSCSDRAAETHIAPHPTTSNNGKGGNWVWHLGDPILPLSDFALIGQHNLQNLLMAVATARYAGISIPDIQQAIKTFSPMPHRLQPVRELAGVTFINDSKATNYDAALVGLKSISGPVVLIAGGDPKLGDDTHWFEAIRAKARAVVLIGKAGPQFAARLEEFQYTEFQIVEGLEAAVPIAFERAREVALSSPATVLLSPACASFDRYPNFERRGEHFRQCCQRLVL